MSRPRMAYRAQLLDEGNVSRRATVILAGMSERKAKGTAARMARAAGLVLVTFAAEMEPSR